MTYTCAYVLVLNHSVVFDSATPWTIALQASVSTSFLRQEYWSGLPFPPPGHLPDPGIEPNCHKYFNTENCKPTEEEKRI